MKLAEQNRNYNYSIFENFETEKERIISLLMQGEYTAPELSRLTGIKESNVRRACSNLSNRDGLLRELPARRDIISNKLNIVYKLK
jgi:Fic family protein